MQHKHQSARDCLVGTRVADNLAKSDPRLRSDGPLLKKMEPNVQRHFESVFTDHTHNTIVFDDADPYDQSEMFNE